MMRLDLKTETVCQLCGLVIQKDKAEQYASGIESRENISIYHYSACCEPCLRLKCDKDGLVLGRPYT